MAGTAQAWLLTRSDVPGRRMWRVVGPVPLVVPSFLGCGKCWYCEHDEWSLCDNTHPKPELAEPELGFPPGGIPGYSHAFGGYAGSHAETLSRNLFQLPLQQTRRDQLRYLLYRSTTPNRPHDWKVVQVAGRSVPLHAFRWPFVLVQRILKRPFRRGAVFT